MKTRTRLFNFAGCNDFDTLCHTHAGLALIPLACDFIRFSQSPFECRNDFWHTSSTANLAGDHTFSFWITINGFWILLPLLQHTTQGNTIKYMLRKYAAMDRRYVSGKINGANYLLSTVFFSATACLLSFRSHRQTAPPRFMCFVFLL